MLIRKYMMKRTELLSINEKIYDEKESIIKY